MQHHFTVPVPVDVAWPAIIDPERVAPCMPGATLSSAEGNDFAGSVKVKLGPISLLYKGTGSFKEVDEAGRRVVIDASGKDSRGNGTAAATVTVTLTADGDGTSAQVDTDLKVTGKPAQLGRGLMSEVGGKILNQFAGNLARSLTGDDTGAASGTTGPGEAAKSGTTGEAGRPGDAAKSGEAAKAGEAAGEAKSAAGQSTNGEHPAEASAAAKAARVGRTPAWRVTSPASERAGSADAVASSTTAAQRPAERADSVITGGTVPNDEAIDLLGAAGTPVLKRALPVAAAVLVVGLLLRRLRRRRHGRA
nr:SRPBCC family protein [Saccharopolyspora sp. NFXS83]